ncbi:hypothetical protein L3Q82_002170 [Scortum barcoo]|uniref:Uncharacterized protein n=1 Tax=Scortum barcoo TaxID=214431 RepID=A0ACB8W1U9_9TELE|nr:hypothetical protein L3Q82_002170 [Scortum barcoo]
MTADQWAMIREGTPDSATKIILAELLLDLIALVSASLVSALKEHKRTGTAVTEEIVLLCMGPILSHTFENVLDIKDKTSCPNKERLIILIIQDVVESVNSALTASKATVRVTAPQRLNVMVDHASEMLKEFTSKMKCLWKPKPQKKRSPILSIQEEKEKDVEAPEVAVSEDHCKTSATSVEPDTSEKRSSTPMDSLITETTKAVQDIIATEVSNIIEPLLDDLTDTEYQQLQTDTATEIQNTSRDITQLIVKEAEDLTESATPTSLQISKLPLNGVGEKIKSFFAKCYTKSQIQRMMAQLKDKFMNGSKAENKESVQILDAAVESLLAKEMDDKQDGDEASVISLLEVISKGSIQSFPKALSDHLYNQLLQENKPEQSRRATSCRSIKVAPTRETVYEDIQNKVWRLLGMLAWWLTTQATVQSNRLMLAIKNAEAAKPTVAEKSPTSQEEGPRAKRNKVCLKLIMDKLVLRTCKKAKVSAPFEETIMISLFEKIRAKIKLTDLFITHNTVKNIDKAIFKDLCKQWGDAENILILVCLEDPQIEKSIISTFKKHLTTPLARRNNTVIRLLSLVDECNKELKSCLIQIISCSTGLSTKGASEAGHYLVVRQDLNSFVHLSYFTSQLEVLCLSPLDSVCSWLTGPWLLGLLCLLHLDRHPASPEFSACKLLIAALPSIHQRGLVSSVSLPRSSLKYSSSQLCCIWVLLPTRYRTIWPFKMDPAHASSPESRLERIEQTLTLRQHEARFAMAAATEIQQATTTQAEGLAAITSQVQQLMAAWLSLRRQQLPPRRLDLLRLLAQLLLAPFWSPGWAIPSTHAGAESCDPFITNCSILYALQPQTFFHQRRQKLRSPSTTCLVGLVYGELLSGSSGPQPACPF